LLFLIANLFSYGVNISFLKNISGDYYIASSSMLYLILTAILLQEGHEMIAAKPKSNIIHAIV
jgi:hypothetical protein